MTSTNRRAPYRLLILLAVVAVGAALAWHSFRSPTPKDTPLTHVSLRLPIPAVDMGFAPYYIGVDKGIFAKHGLDVALEPGTPELNPVKMVAQGQNEFGLIGGPELLLSGRSKGAPIKGLLLLNRNSNFTVVITLKDSGITTLAQLAGKRVGFFVGHISTDILHMLFKKNGVSIEERDVGFDYGPLIAKDIDAEWGFRTTGGINLPARGVGINMINPADYGIVTHGYVVMANEKVIAERPAIVQSFVDAVIESVEYELAHPEEAIQAARSRDPNFQQDVAEKQAAIYHETIRNNLRVGWIEMTDMEQVRNQMAEAGLLPAGLDVTGAFDTAFVKTHYEVGH